MPKIKDGNRGAPVADLWKRIQGLYTTHPCSSRRENLTETMSRKSPAQAPRSGGSSPIAGVLARDLLGDDDLLEAAVKRATSDVEGCYQCLSCGSDASRLAEHCARFCTWWVSLQEQFDYFFSSRAENVRVFPNAVRDVRSNKAHSALDLSR